MTDSGKDASEATDRLIAEVQVTGPGVAITRPVDEATMASVIALIFGAPPAAMTAVGQPAPAAHHGSTNVPAAGGHAMADLALSEFLDLSEPKTFPHKIVTAAYYLTEIQGVEHFTRSDVKDALVAAREVMPANYHRDFGNAVAASFIAAKPGDSEVFYITKTGKSAVVSKFQELPKRRAARRSAKKAPNGGGA